MVLIFTNSSRSTTATTPTAHRAHSSYWRRSRQNKEQSRGTRGRARTGLHIYLTHRENLSLISLDAAAVVWLVVKFVIRRPWRWSSLSLSVFRVRFDLRCTVTLLSRRSRSRESHTPRGGGATTPTTTTLDAAAAMLLLLLLLLLRNRAP